MRGKINRRKIWVSREVMIEATEVGEFLARDCREEKKEGRKSKARYGYYKVSKYPELRC